MNISKEDFLAKHCIKLKDRIIYPKYEYESFDEETMSYVGLVIIKTAEEMQEAENKIDNCSEKTTEQKLEEAQEEIAHLKENELILAENIYQLANVIELLVGGTESGQV